MTKNQNYRPNDYLVQINQNTGKNKDTTLLQLKYPRCQDLIVSQCVSPETGSATMNIIIGNASSDVGATTGISHPVSENYQAQSVAQINTFMSSIRGAVIRIFTHDSDMATQLAIDGAGLSYRETLPDTITTAEGDTWTCIFCGIIWEVQQATGLYSQEVSIVATDLGGFMNLKTQAIALKSIYDPVSGNVTFGGVMPHNFPDWNMKIADVVVGNKDPNGVKTTPIVLGDGYQITLNLTPFNGIDPSNVNGKNRQLWTALDILQYHVQYMTDYYQPLFGKAGITFAFNDLTGNLSASIGTFSNRQTLWKTLCEVINRKSGLYMWWSYAVGDQSTLSVVATLNVGFLSDVALAGFNPATVLSYTEANGYPVGQYRSDPVVSYVDNDASPYIRCSTLPCALSYTFNLADQFFPGWDTTATPPDNDTIAAGGIYSKWYSRFIFNPQTMNQITSYNILTSPAPETWAPTCLVGLQWTSTSGPGTAAVELIDTAIGGFQPFDETIKLSRTIPISNVSPLASLDTKNTPGLVFAGDGPGFGEVIDDCTPRFLANSIQFNPPKDSADSIGGIDRFALAVDRKNVFITAQVEGLPPLIVTAYKDGIISNDTSFLDVVIPYKPTFCMGNTVLGIDQNGAFIVSTPPATGVATLVASDGTTLQKLWDDMNRYTQFFARQKNKCQWTISFIDPNNLLGQYCQDLDVPTVNSSNLGGNPDPDAVVGVGEERFQTLDVNTLVTKIVWNFKDQTTTYATDFINYVPKTDGR